MSESKRHRKFSREYILHIMAEPGTNPPPLSANPVNTVDIHGRTVWEYTIPSATIAFAFISQQATIIHQYKWCLYAVNGRGKWIKMHLQLWHRRRESVFGPENMEQQLVRWHRRHPNAPLYKTMQLVLEGRRAGLSPDKVDPVEMRKKMHVRYQDLQKQVLALQRVESNLRKTIARMGNGSTHRHVPAMQALVEQHLRFNRHISHPESPIVFAVGLDSNREELPQALLASLTYFGDNGAKAVEHFRDICERAGLSSRDAGRYPVLYVYSPTNAFGEKHLWAHKSNEHDALGMYSQYVSPKDDFVDAVEHH